MSELEIVAERPPLDPVLPGRCARIDGVLTRANGLAARELRDHFVEKPRDVIDEHLPRDVARGKVLLLDGRDEPLDDGVSQLGQNVGERHCAAQGI